MALELRPNCEYCNKDLPVDATDAMICSFECTFCANCVETKLNNVCPNCGSGFCSRPIRPSHEWRKGVSLYYAPTSKKHVHLKWSKQEVETFISNVKHIPPDQR